MSAGRPWLVVRVRPHWLATAIKNMERQGCECYSPSAMMRSGSTNVLRVQPLFIGYVFVRPLDEQWTFLARGTFGVLDVLMGTSECPAELADAEIARLRAREDAEGLVQLGVSEFSVGDKVRVEKGAVSLDAIVDGMSGQDRVFVLMEVLGAQRRVEVEAKDVTR